MLQKLLLFFTTAVVLVNSAAIFEEDTILSVVQIFRHGERTPLKFYPTDPYKDPSYWDGLGTGQLTKFGKSQLTELGKYFRDKYDGFVSANYSDKEIYMRTVSGKRNLESAEAFLAGLYQENSDIPVHPCSIAVMGSLVECLRFDLEWLELELTNGYFKEINEENSENYKYISEHSESSVSGLLGAYSIWDTLDIENRFNYMLPKWTDAVFPDKLTNLSDLFASSICYTQKQQRLASGVFIHELVDHFESVLSHQSTQKIQLYSVHDVNIACLLSSLEAFSKPHIPEFASSVIFELRQGTNGSYVNAYYKPDDELVPISVRGCAFDCGIEEFRTAVAAVAIDKLKWVEKCYTPL